MRRRSSRSVRATFLSGSANGGALGGAFVQNQVRPFGKALGVAVLAAGLGVWGLTGSASAAPTALFSSSTPGFQAGAATVPADICFVSITAEGGHGGTAASLSGGVAASLSARVAVTPGASLSVQVGGAGTAGSQDPNVGGQGGSGGGGGA